MKKKIFNDNGMRGTLRHVNVRGYIMFGKVLGRNNEGEWGIELRSGKIERVPEHLFYHMDAQGFLHLRESLEFKRKYPNHPIEIEKI